MTRYLGITPYLLMELPLSHMATLLVVFVIFSDTEYIQVFAVVQLNVSYARVHWQFSDNITDDDVTVFWCKGSYNSMLCTVSTRII